MRIEVHCYAGYTAEERPRRIVLGEREVEVEEVLDRWHGPDHRYFKVRGDDGAIYILRHDIESWVWDLTVYDRSRCRR